MDRLFGAVSMAVEKLRPSGEEISGDFLTVKYRKLRKRMRMLRRRYAGQSCN